MVKRTYNYIAFCLPVLVSLVVISCSSGVRREMMIKDSLMMDSIVKDSIAKATLASSGFEFENDTLSAASLKAFETRASQKLKDVYDYTQMMLDPSIEKSFKMEAKQMMLALFESSENKIEITLQKNGGPQAIPIKDFTENAIGKTSANFHFKIQNITTSLEITRNKTYKGLISYTHTLYRIENSQPVIIQQGPMTSEYHIKKIKKKFGASEKEIWEVLLGDIVRDNK
jgi:hypothetical protein